MNCFKVHFVKPLAGQRWTLREQQSVFYGNSSANKHKLAITQMTDNMLRVLTLIVLWSTHKSVVKLYPSRITFLRLSTFIKLLKIYGHPDGRQGRGHQRNHCRDDLNTSAGDRKTTMNKNDWKDFGENEWEDVA